MGDAISEAFDQLDAEGRGQVTGDQIRNMIEQMQTKPGDYSSLRMAAALFDSAASGSTTMGPSDTVSKSSFIDMVCQQPQLHCLFDQEIRLLIPHFATFRAGCESGSRDDQSADTFKAMLVSATND